LYRETAVSCAIKQVEFNLFVGEDEDLKGARTASFYR
jgi:hypothetical protein